MRLDIQNTEVVYMKKLRQKIGEKLGTEDRDKIEAAILRNKLVDLMDEYSLELCAGFDANIEKLSQMLKQYGLIVKPKAKLNVPSIVKFIGKANFDEIKK